MTKQQMLRCLYQNKRTEKKSKNKFVIMYKYHYHVCLVGDANTGKTSLVDRWVHNRFLNSSHEMTIGVDFATTRIDVQDDEPQTQVGFWDTAGQEIFQSITAAYYRQVAAIILVYSVKSRMSFQSLNGWLKRVRGEHTADKMPLIFVIGNKQDSSRLSRVTFDEAQEWCDRNHVDLHMQVSAKTGYKTVEALHDIVCRLRKRVQDGDWPATRAYGIGVNWNYVDDGGIFMGHNNNNNNNVTKKSVSSRALGCCRMQ